MYILKTKYEYVNEAGNGKKRSKQIRMVIANRKKTRRHSARTRLKNSRVL